MSKVTFWTGRSCESFLDLWGMWSVQYHRSELQRPPHPYSSSFSGINESAPVLPSFLPGSIQGLNQAHSFISFLCAILQIVLMNYRINCFFSPVFLACIFLILITAAFKLIFSHSVYISQFSFTYKHLCCFFFLPPPQSPYYALHRQYVREVIYVLRL